MTHIDDALDHAYNDASASWRQEADPFGDTNEMIDEDYDDRTVELDELLRTDDAPYDWQVEGLLELGDRLIVTGPEGMGKSTLLRQLAVQLASGVHPFTHEPTDPWNVLYVDAENSRRQVRRKMGPLRAAAGHRYHVDAHLIFAFRQDLDLTKMASVAWLESLAKLYMTRVLIIGPLYKLATGDPKSEDQARLVAGALDHIRNAVGCSVIIEAHTPYSDSSKSTRPLRPYGASLWSRWPEFGIHLGPEGDLTHWRGQRDERQWPQRLERGAPWPWMPRETRAETAAWNGPTRCIEAIVELLSHAPGQPYSGRQLVNALRIAGHNFRDRTVTEAAERAAMQGLVTVRSGARNARVFSVDHAIFGAQP